jgi:hypothetical protein
MLRNSARRTADSEPLSVINLLPSARLSAFGLEQDLDLKGRNL